MCSHVLNKGEQIVRYYGFYSNVSRGERKIQGKNDATPSILEPDASSKEFRKNWALLIQKIYEVDLLFCPKCQEPMKIIAFIQDQEVVKKILKHVGLWERKTRPPPKSKAPPIQYIEDTESQKFIPDELLLMESFYTRFKINSWASWTDCVGNIRCAGRVLAPPLAGIHGGR